MLNITDASPSALGPGKVVLAIDVGGTDTKSAIIDGKGRVRGHRRTSTPRDDQKPAEAVVEHIAAVAADLREEYPELRPVAAGLVVPGIVDASRGIGVYSNNLGWRNSPLQLLASTALDLPVALHHDVTAAGIAEHRMGAARGLADVVILIIGTGIAATLVLGGKAHLGGGFAGEIGHAPVAEQPHCVCGGRGCLEAIASTAAIARRYAERSDTRVRGASEVLSLMRAGDDDARIVWEQALDALALGIAQLASTIAPEVVVIGGGLSQAGPALFGPLSARIDARLSYQRRPRLVAAELGADAGLQGAALIAREAASA
ncbi:UNVERIFIED_CONTAM: ROK family protein [Microbacterium sp. SLM126]